MDAALKDQLRERAMEDDRLYDQFAASLEATHRGQYVAIGKAGEVLVGPDQVALLDRALGRFGRGNFAFRKIGERALGHWR
jgi:predicted aspartyl protease